MALIWRSIVAACLCVSVVGAPRAFAQSGFPAKPIHIVVPFAAGGSADVIARMVGQKLSENWAQPVIVDNKPGGTGVVGSEAVKSAAPDGYTILLGSASTHSVSPAVHPKLSYRLEDFTPLTLIATFPNMLVVHPRMPPKSVPEFIALLKANPNKYNFSSTGPGGSVHLAAELFMQMTGTKMTHVAYKGTAPALNDLLGGQIDCTFDNMTALLPYVQAGNLRALGVGSLKRVKAAPDLPAIAEFVPGYEATTWVGLFGPRGVSDDIANKYAAEVARIVAAPDMNKRLEDLGATGQANTPAEFKHFVQADTDKWRKVVDTAGIVLEE